MTDSAEKMREAIKRFHRNCCYPEAFDFEVDGLMNELAALSASGTKSDGAKAIKTALIAAGCDTGDGSYVHAAMVSVIAAILADPIPSQPDKVEAIAETIWRAEYRRATGRERSVPWSEVSSTDRERYRYVADNILAMQAERRGVKP